MSTREEEQELVTRMAVNMETKLAASRAKNHEHWREPSMAFLIRRLLEEVGELIGATRQDAWSEAADVANFAAMIADRITGEA